MKKSHLYPIWAALFAVCAGLGFLPAPEGSLKVLCILLSVAFFVPPLMLIRIGDRQDIALVRILSAMALTADLVLLVLNILSASFSETVGTILHCVLIIAGSPLICSQCWALVLFLWAFSMLYAHQELNKA